MFPEKGCLPSRDHENSPPRQGGWRRLWVGQPCGLWGVGRFVLLYSTSPPRLWKPSPTFMKAFNFPMPFSTVWQTLSLQGAGNKHLRLCGPRDYNQTEVQLPVAKKSKPVRLVQEERGLCRCQDLGGWWTPISKPSLFLLKPAILIQLSL